MKKVLVFLAIISVFSFMLLLKPQHEIIVSAYRNHCWRCSSTIDSAYCSRCRYCGWYICDNCGACESSCERMDYIYDRPSNNSSKEDDDDNTWIWIVLICVGLPAIGIYLENRK